MLTFLEKLTATPDGVTPADITPLRAAGLSDDQIEDAIHVCTCFNLIVRIADSFDFAVPSRASFDASAKMLLKRGYILG